MRGTETIIRHNTKIARRLNKARARLKKRHRKEKEELVRKYRRKMW